MTESAASESIAQSDRPLTGRLAVVTGAARGLGLAYARRLVALGADVVAIDRNLQAAAEFGEDLGGGSLEDSLRTPGRRVLALEVDLTNRSAVDAAITTVMETFGRVDILVNNAGGLITPIERSRPTETSDADVALTWDVNFMTMLHCCQAVAPIMRSQGSGVIVNTSSTGARQISAAATGAVYGATKAAVTQFTRALAMELGPAGVRVNAIAPGIMLTSRVAAQASSRGIGTPEQVRAVPLGRFGEPDDCAGVVEFLVTDLSRYVTGQCISVCGGSTLTPA